jgi:hypothetical protein
MANNLFNANYLLFLFRIIFFFQIIRTSSPGFYLILHFIIFTNDLNSSARVLFFSAQENMAATTDRGTAEVPVLRLRQAFWLDADAVGRCIPSHVFCLDARSYYLFAISQSIAIAHESHHLFF